MTLSMRLGIVGALALLATACNGSPTSPESISGNAAPTGLRVEAFSVADQPAVGPDQSCQSDAPTEFTVVQTAPKTLTGQWRRQRNTTRWQVEIRDHEQNQNIHEEHTADVVSVFDWLAKLTDRAYDMRVRAANVGCTPGKWTEWVTRGFDGPPAPVPVAPSGGGFWWWEEQPTHGDDDCEESWTRREYRRRQQS